MWPMWLAYDASNLVFALSAVVDLLVVCGAIWWATSAEPREPRLTGAPPRCPS